MGDTLSAWQGAVEHMLGILFDGSEESMELLTNVMDHGQLIPSGDPETGIPEAPLLAPTNDDRTSMKAGIEKDFYTYIIPSAWSASGKSVFVMDTGLGCKGGNLKEVRLSDDAPTACHDGTLYAIVYPYGEADDCGYGTGGSCIYNKFSIPPGAKQLGDEKWGGLTVKDLVVG